MDIKRLRKILCLTQDQLAKELGVKQVQVFRWENNQFEPSIASLRKIKALCEKHDLDYTEFVKI